MCSGYKPKVDGEVKRLISELRTYGVTLDKIHDITGIAKSTLIKQAMSITKSPIERTVYLLRQLHQRACVNNEPLESILAVMEQPEQDKRDYRPASEIRAERSRKLATVEKEKRVRLQAEIDRAYPRNRSLDQFAESVRHRVVGAKRSFGWTSYNRAE